MYLIRESYNKLVSFGIKRERNGSRNLPLVESIVRFVEYQEAVPVLFDKNPVIPEETKTLVGVGTAEEEEAVADPE